MADTAAETSDPGTPSDSFDSAFNAAASTAGIDPSGGDSGDEGEGEGSSAAASTEERPGGQTEEEDHPQEASVKTDETDESAEAAAVSVAAATTTDSAVEAMSEGDPKVGKMLADLKAANPALFKEQQRYFTQRQQKIAAQEKFISAFQKDPEGAAKAVLAEIQKASGAPAATALALDQKLAAAGFTPDQAKVVAELVAPVADVQESLRQENVRRAATAIDGEVQSFKKDHPDFDLIEKEMNSWAERISPTESMTPRDYLSVLRTLALGDKAVSERVTKALNRMVKNAASAPPKISSVPAGVVRPGTPGRLPSWEESVEMALRGEVVGRGISR